MRQWQAPAVGRQGGAALGGMIHRLGEQGFETAVLDALHPVMPAASWSVYRTGPRCRPTLFMSASRGIPDTTHDCWWAYLSGPYLHDRTLGCDEAARSAADAPQLCHITAKEIGAEHRARVYDAHGMVERVSVIQHEGDDAVFAVNFYRHAHQPAFSDTQIATFETLSPALLELARKHIALTGGSGRATAPAQEALDGPSASPVSPMLLRERLLDLQPQLTRRELDICVRLLQGMTHEGVAADLGLGLPTVKTYRNRAFARLGIHFRNELFALVLKFRRAA